MRKRAFATLVLAASGLAGSGASARGRSDSAHGQSERPRHPEHSAVSIGTPSDGRLEGAVELGASTEVRLRNPHAPHWGLPTLIDLIERSAKKVAARFKGATLLVGDLSRRQGGDLAGHKSHESGRDADIAFMFVGPNGESVAPNELMTVDLTGTAVENRSFRFDDARNWALVEAWVTDPEARVEHIFIAEHLRSRLLAFARAKGTYLPVLHRAALAMKQPRSGLSHDDHFHVRIACPRSQRNVCVPIAASASPYASPTLRVGHSRPAGSSRALVKARKERETTRR